MTNKKLLLLMFFFLFTAAKSQTYHSISIDGVNDFRASTEKFTTTSGENLLAYVTWDNTYLYVGYSGNSVAGSVTDNSRAIHLYIDSDPNSNPVNGTGTTQADAWRFNPNLPFSANYHYAFKTVDNTEVKRMYSGTAWSDAAFETANWKNTDTHYWEARIKLSDIGSPAKLLLVTYVEEDWDGGNICGGVPSGLFTNTATQGAIVFQPTFLGFELIQGIRPNAAYNLNNSTFDSWDVKLSVTASSLSDNLNYAGMGYYGSDGFDTLIDLPKPVTPPSNYLQLYFEHNDWSSVLGPLYSKDIKSIINLNNTTSTWDFKINTDKTNTDVTLSVTDFADVPAGYDIKLKDVAANTTQNLRTTGSYTYNSGVGGVKSFQLIIGVNVVQNILVAPTALNFGNVLINTSSVKNVKIYNTGNGNLAITNIFSSSSSYTFTGGTTYTILPNDSVTVPVEFNPLLLGSHSGELNITSDDPDQPTVLVALSGSGYQTMSNISVNPTSLAFGDLLVGNNLAKSLKIYNTGNANLSITNIASSNAAFTFSGGTTHTIVPNDSLTIQVTFTPAAAIVYSAKLTITNNDPDQGTLDVNLTGTGTQLQPAITINPAELIFGNVAVGNNGEMILTVGNTGQATLNVTNIIIDNSVFSYSGNTSFSVAASSSTNLSIQFVPTAVISYTGKLKIVSNAPSGDTTAVNLSGAGVTTTAVKKFYSGWNLMSIPVNPTNPLASSVIGSSISPFYLYGFNNASGYVSKDSVLVGNGYWLGIEDSVNLSITGIGLTGIVTKNVNQGWNLVSSPFLRQYQKSSVMFTKGLETISADSAVTRGWIQNAYYNYLTATKNYNLSDTLKQWKGYWFASLVENLQMKYNIVNSNGTPVNIKGELLEPSITDWKVNILASINGVTDNLLAFGANINAIDGFDARYDLAKPPVTPTNISIQTYFNNTIWNTVFSKYAYDIKKSYSAPTEGKVWEFKVFSNSAGPITISWTDILAQIPQSLLDSYKFSLSGFGITSSLNMLTTLNYTFTAEANVAYSFAINSTVTGVDNDELNDYSYKLEQNYPNPFNPATIITYSVPEQTFVTLKIYDVLGNEITTLVNREVNTGVHQVTFNASNLSSGVYFYTIKAGKFLNTKKLMLTK
ncbi:MAG: choice-of-anchor D domain-containing protein [bacterium]